MPQRPRVPCSASGCPTLVAPGRGRRCPTHRLPSPDRPSPAELGYDAEWRAIRGRVLRARTLCEQCWLSSATEVDHIIPLRNGGTHDEANLQALCKSCHSRKTARETAMRMRGTR